MCHHRRDILVFRNNDPNPVRIDLQLRRLIFEKGSGECKGHMALSDILERRSVVSDQMLSPVLFGICSNATAGSDAN